MTKWTQKELCIIQENYGNIKIKDLASLLPNRTIQAIQKLAQRLGLSANYSLAQRIYNFDELYFDNPNIYNSYWAGFIAADGCILRDGGIQIAISSKDIDILYAFKKAVQYDGPIKIFISKNKEYAKITIWGAYRWQKMLQKYWNVTRRKSNTLIRPKIKCKDLQLAYIIGYIDGDGSIFITNRADLILSICGTKSVITWIAKVLNRCFGVKIPLLHYNGLSITNRKISWSTNHTITIIRHLLDINTGFRLNRKWDKINEITK